MIKLYYASAHLLAGLAYRAGGCRRRLFDRAPQLRRRRAAQAGISGDQSQGPRAGAGDRPGHPDRDAGDPRLHRPEFSAGEAGAAGRSVPVRASAGLQQLSVRDRCMSPMPTACAAIAGPTIRPPSRPCSARCRRSVGLLPADRGEHAGRALGDGRGLHDLRSLPVHHGAVAGGRTASIRRGFPRSSITGAGCRNGGRFATPSPRNSPELRPGGRAPPGPPRA